MTKLEANRIWGWEPLLEKALRDNQHSESEIKDSWNKIDNWWKSWSIDHPDQPDALRSLLLALRKCVPIITIENGVERFERHLELKDDDWKWEGRSHLRGAVQILAIGELEATVDGDPPASNGTWSEYRSRVKDYLSSLIKKDDVTKGDEQLSRRKHAAEAIKLLHEIDLSFKWAASELETDDEQVWLSEVIAEIAHRAFDAGRRTQAAYGKEFESFAASRLKQTASLTGSSTANANRRAQAATWKRHAELVMKQFSKKPSTNSECARWIVKKWSSVAGDLDPPVCPSAKTIQNWLSHRN